MNYAKTINTNIEEEYVTLLAEALNDGWMVLSTNSFLFAGPEYDTDIQWTAILMKTVEPEREEPEVLKRIREDMFRQPSVFLTDLPPGVEHG